MEGPPPFTIVGAGLAGTLMACHLARTGQRVDLHEKRADPRSRERDAGRSINLAISVRGIEALREVDLADEVLRTAIPMRGRMMHARDGTLTVQPYGKDPSECIYSISRADLNRTLIESAARHDTVRLNFRSRCTGIDLANATVQLHDEETGQTRAAACNVVIAADGAFSVVRSQMQKQDRFDYRQDYLTHGYKELHIPAGPGAAYRMEKHALHIWPRRSFMMIALPNPDGSFTCTLFWPFEGPNSFASAQTDAEIRQFFEEQFPDAAAMMPSLLEDYRANPTGSLATIRCSPWSVRDRVVLIGDACHAVVPFLGQGMNAAFEDCTVLNSSLLEAGKDRAAAFRDYERQRKPNTDTLAELAIDNFLEMRDRVRSPLFLLRKRVDHLLHRLLPGSYVPLYTLVTFTRTPYAEAVRRVRRQEWVVRAVLGSGLILLFLVLLLVVYAATR